MAPVDLCGTIRSTTWIAEQHLAAVPGASGTLGQERSVPAHGRVVLQPFDGISPATAHRLSALVGGSELAADAMLVLVPEVDPARLAAGRRLCLVGYKITGDEGITRASRTSLTLE
jgi:hypothetical protein